MKKPKTILAMCKRNIGPIAIGIGFYLLCSEIFYVPYKRNAEFRKKDKIIVYESADDADKDRGQLSLDETRIQYQVIRSSPER